MTRKRAHHAGVLLLVVGCATTEAAVQEMALMPFNDLVYAVTSFRIDTVSGQNPRYAVDGVIRGDTIAILDQQGPDIKLYSLSAGRLLSRVGMAGDNVGEWRRPVAITELHDGQVAVWDPGRELVVFRDLAGSVQAEVPPPRGFFTGLVASPNDQAVLLAGEVYTRNEAIRERDMHELSDTTSKGQSYCKSVRPQTTWQQRLNTVAADRVGPNIVSVTMNSEVLRVCDPNGRTQRWLRIAPGWYKGVQFPHRPWYRKKEGRVTGDGLREFLQSQQRIVNGVFAPADGRVLLRFITFERRGGRFYYYAVMDTVGRSYGITQATRAQVLASKADSLLWVERRGSDLIIARGIAKGPR